MRFLPPGYQLDLLLVRASGRYGDKLRRLAARDERIHIREPVAMAELPLIANDCDLGLYLLPDSNDNHKFALPNKFFEFVQARLGVAISPIPEMAGVASRWGFGLVAPDFSPEALARTIEQASREDIALLKQRAHAAAATLSAEATAHELRSLVEAILRSGHLVPEPELGVDHAPQQRL
jgi:hypothetical protein